MNIHFNTMVKNEALLLDHVLPIWKTYSVDQFVFYDDEELYDSSDNEITDDEDVELVDDSFVYLPSNDEVGES